MEFSNIKKQVIKHKKYYIIFVILLSIISLSFFIYNKLLILNINNVIEVKAKIISNKKVTQFYIDILDQGEKINSILINKSFQKYIEDRKDIENIQQLFLTISKSYKYIFQLRYLDQFGKEVIRIDKNHANIASIIPQNKLQNKKDRYYFKEIMEQKDSLWYSKIDLNMEHGKIEKPIKPTLRVAKQIFIDGSSKGFIIINIAMKHILNSLARDSKFNLYIIDKDGDYLYHQKRVCSWSKYLSCKNNIFKNSDGLTLNMLKKRKFYLENKFFQKLYLENGEGLTLVIEAKQKYINNLYYEYTNKFLLYGLIILLFLILILYILFSIKNNKIKEQLYKSEKMSSMGEMIGNIAHQWRQPLSLISTAATGIKIQKEYGLLSDEEFDKSCDAINDNAQYLSKTIDDFRNFIKGDRVKEIFSLKKEIDSFLNLVEGSIKNHDINIILDLQENINIDGYENELTQCYINIFNNAKDILKEKVKSNRMIFISTMIKNNQVLIKIKDNGGGIPKDVLPNIFEPYFTTKHKSQGTGLGLNMTYNLIVDGMEGKIEAKNKTYKYMEVEYIGAEFLITLPIKKSESPKVKV